jgi:hypothetical protein
VTAADRALLERLGGWVPGGRFSTFEVGWWPLVVDPAARPPEDGAAWEGAFRVDLRGGGFAELAVYDREATFALSGPGTPDERAARVLDVWLEAAGLAREGAPTWCAAPLARVPRDGSWFVRSLEVDHRLAQLLSDPLGALLLCLPRARVENP